MKHNAFTTIYVFKTIIIYNVLIIVIILPLFSTMCYKNKTCVGASASDCLQSCIINYAILYSNFVRNPRSYIPVRYNRW